MFVHIILWKLKEHANGRSRDENVRLIKERLEELPNMVDGVQRWEVGINTIPRDDVADISLYSVFESRQAFDAYIAHPAHQALVPFVREVRAERRGIDYEV